MPVDFHFKEKLFKSRFL